MNYIRTSIKRRKHILIFLISILIIGFILGIFYYHFQDKVTKDLLISEINLTKIPKINNVLKDLFIFPSLIFLLFIIIGLPLSLFYLFYEGLSLGFTTSVIIHIYKAKGIIFMSKYFLFIKVIFLILLLIFNIKLIDCTKNIIGLLVYKKDERIKRNLIYNFKKLLFSFILIIVYDLILLLLSSLIFKYLITIK